MSSGPSASPSAPRDADAPASQGRILHRTLQDGSGDRYILYRPGAPPGSAPFVVLIHDASRDADRLIEQFSADASRRGAVLIAPQFSEEHYPGYQRLGRRHDGDERGARASATLDAMADEVAARLGVPRPALHLFGLGAGARFALRYALAFPGNVASVAIAEAGTYTFPDPERRFPRGIAPSPGHADLAFDLERFMELPVTVFESRAGGGPGGAPPRRSRAGRANRADRGGRSWVAAMRAAAAERRMAPAVSYRELEGPGALTDVALADRVLDALLEPPVGAAALAQEAAASERERAAELRGSRLRRAGLIALAAAALLAAAAPLALWAHYRATHVVSRDAVVRGHIADVGARLEGVIERVEVQPGDRVRAGQVVAKLEDRHFQARVQEARSKLEKATRELEVERLAIANERLRLEGTLRKASAGVSAATAAVQAAESRAAEAQRRMELHRVMAAQGLVSEEQLHTTASEHRTALALLSAARAEHGAATAVHELAEVDSEGIAVRQQRVSVLESTIAAYRAELAVAEANLDGALIRAPGDGAVVRRIVEPGGATVVGQPILSIWIGGETWVEAWVDEDQLADIEVGGPATVTFSSHRDQEFAGVVESIGVSTDFELPDEDVPQPRHERMRAAPLIGVRIRLDEPAQDLMPGLSAVVGIRRRTAD